MILKAENKKKISMIFKKYLQEIFEIFYKAFGANFRAICQVKKNILYHYPVAVLKNIYCIIVSMACVKKKVENILGS